jgi:hypothetical protein
MKSGQTHRRTTSFAIGIRFKSDNEKEDSQTLTTGKCLPMGEYHNTRSNSKVNLNLIKLEPIHYKRASIELDKELILSPNSNYYKFKKD